MDACESTLCRPNTVQVCCDVRGNINPIMVNIEVKEKHHIRRNNSMNRMDMARFKAASLLQPITGCLSGAFYRCGSRSAT